MRILLCAVLTLQVGCATSGALVTDSPTGWINAATEGGSPVLMWCDATRTPTPVCTTPYFDRRGGGRSLPPCEGLDPKRYNCTP